MTRKIEREKSVIEILAGVGLASQLEQYQRIVSVAATIKAQQVIDEADRQAVVLEEAMLKIANNEYLRRRFDDYISFQAKLLHFLADNNLRKYLARMIPEVRDQSIKLAVAIDFEELSALQTIADLEKVPGLVLWPNTKVAVFGSGEGILENKPSSSTYPYSAKAVALSKDIRVGMQLTFAGLQYNTKREERPDDRAVVKRLEMVPVHLIRLHNNSFFSPNFNDFYLTPAMITDKPPRFFRI